LRRRRRRCRKKMPQKEGTEAKAGAFLDFFWVRAHTQRDTTVGTMIKRALTVALIAASTFVAYMVAEVNFRACLLLFQG